MRVPDRNRPGRHRKPARHHRAATGLRGGNRRATARGAAALPAALPGTLPATLPATVAVATSALLLAVSARPWGTGALAWIAFVPLIHALERARSPWRGAVAVFLVALGPATVAYEALAPLAPLAAGFVIASAAAVLAPAGALAVRARRVCGPGAVAWALPLFWCALEAVPAQSWLWGRWTAPLLRLGYGQFGLPTAHLARLGGVTLVGAVVLACNGLLFVVLGGHRAPGRTRRAAGAGLVVLACAAAAAARTAPRTDPAPGTRAPGAAVRLVQPALPDAAYAAARLLPGARRALLDHLMALTGGAGTVRPAAAPALTLWPEGSAPVPLSATPPWDASARELDRRLAGVGPVLLGAGARSNAGFSNAAYLRTDALRRVYSKRRLVPVAAEARLVPGEQAAVVEVAGLALGTLICFEAAFEGLGRAAVGHGAGVLVVLTNDSYAPFLATARLHLRVAAFRAIETARPLLFVANAGPSAVVAADGRLLARSRGGVAATLDAFVNPGVGRTPYVRYGHGAAMAMILLGLLAAVAVGAKGGATRR